MILDKFYVEFKKKHLREPRANDRNCPLGKNENSVSQTYIFFWF